MSLNMVKDNLENKNTHKLAIRR